MDKQGNTYTFLYAAVMVIIAAAILSSTAIGLKPRQAKNKEIEKKQNILTSVNKGLEANKAGDKVSYIESEYLKYITNSYVVNINGDKVDGDAFTVDLHKELVKPKSDIHLPVFECKDDDGSIKYILPVRGKGLWGPIWGFIALNSDMNTISGAIFDHKGETPGLGAEINKRDFQKPFEGKQIFDKSGKFVSIEVVKGGASKDDIHGVDAISGGTITSKGLEKMLRDNLGLYEAFLNKNRKKD
jgi:Na+-transporting NADH:ubiquinone oxidoreductase subunit C